MKSAEGRDYWPSLHLVINICPEMIRSQVKWSVEAKNIYNNCLHCYSRYQPTYMRIKICIHWNRENY